jgi:hypothetical protein
MNDTPRGPLDNGLYDQRHFAFMREMPGFMAERQWRWRPSREWWQGAICAVIVMLLLMGAR